MVIVIAPVLVSPGYHTVNSMARTTEVDFLTVPGLEVRDQGASMLRFWWEPLPVVTRPPLWARGERVWAGELSGTSSHKGTKPILSRYPTPMTSSNSNYSQRSHLQIPSCWVLELQHGNLEKDTIKLIATPTLLGGCWVVFAESPVRCLVCGAIL